ncbi:hypothetical protein CALVIDRAFT_168531 [Calocera viscosa TUFC12733]|uniref:Uncharacterized protein n=1 Tax=Calocera viscosa (strain TUFC12733) TaxID=1330018 RepID=A0A167L650_CALVF|nr:hypothetical protein CALVIDRAFT_168531 [Calocera viscosa TUFC12733]
MFHTPAKIPDLRPELLKNSQTERLHEHRDRLLSLPCPIHRLPDDLLMEIFEVVVEDEDQSSYSWILSHVSGRWRRLALATPRLWTNIKLSLPFVTPKDAEYLHNSLEWSGSFPLTVRVAITRGAKRGHRQEIINVLDALAFRARAFHLSVDSIAACGFILPVVFSPGMLQLTLAGLEISDSSNWMEALCRAMSPCQSLQTLNLIGWHPLTGMAVLQFLNDNQHRISLPKLHQLSLCGTVAHAVGTRLDCEPRALESNASSIAPSVLRALAPQMCQLRSIALVRGQLQYPGTSIVSNVIVGILQFMPLLEEMSLHSLALVRSVPGPYRPTTPPCLTKITLDRCIDVWGIVDVIEELNPEEVKKFLVLDISVDVVRPIPSIEQLMDWLSPRVLSVSYKVVCVWSSFCVAVVLTPASD